MDAKAPLLFCVVAWMEHYDGIAGDQPSGGGSFIDSEGYGYEIFNFRAFRNHFYGFVEVKGRIALERLGGNNRTESLSGVTVVFVAPFHGERPYVIIGWYLNATVYRSLQEPPIESGRFFEREKIGYNLTAARDHGVLLPVDDRVFEVPYGPYGGKGSIGQARNWYADSPGQQPFVRKVRRYVETYKTNPSGMKPVRKQANGWQTDLERRQLIERNAIAMVWDHFGERGYILRDVQKNNCGWDLEATFGSATLRLEVKGTAGSEVRCELTPNEYRPIAGTMAEYRLCVLCDALGSAPELKIFAWSREHAAWCFGQERLSITVLTGARVCT